MKRTPAQIRRSLNSLATDLTTSGLHGYARRLRRYSTELFGKSEKRVPRKDKWTRVQRRQIAGLGLDHIMRDLGLE
jgi:hypothetical protein